ncbi:MAG: cysteine desulfurase [Oscillospiraceae bacterium]|nr:cysteine desulfurase [Oscillospiraceae bacterium]
MSIYLDNAATTKPCSEAVKAVCDCMEENFGNPSSLHRAGLNAQIAVDNVRKIIAKSIAADPSCIYFTSGATESNNMAIIGSVGVYGKRKPRIVTTSIEHSSVEKAMEHLEQNGFEIVRISPDRNGEISHERIVNAVDENTCLVSIMMVNNETGYILPVRRSFYGIKKLYPQCITHCDAVQGFMKIPFKVSELNADIISFSGHKIHAGKGIGGLYLKKGIRLQPHIFGGGQEKGIRSGTENVPMIASMGAAVKILSKNISERYKKATDLKEKLCSKLSVIDGIYINSHEDASPYIVNISIPGIRSEIMLHFLEEKGIYVSSGSACSKGAKSGVLKEFGLNDSFSDSAVRISFSHETTVSELSQFVKAVEDAKESLVKSR